ncbi:TFIID-31kDa-domain-containing protein, partial [Testicularia cyperi]
MTTYTSMQADTGLRGPIPRDARLVALILASMGISDVQPEVLLQLLEFAHRYTYDVLSDALVYADHANSRQAGSAVSLNDVNLAIQSRVNYSFTAPPEKDMLLALATSINSTPLPPISDRHGVRLPPPQHCLTNVNFSIVPNPPPQDFFDEEEAQPHPPLPNLQAQQPDAQSQSQSQPQSQSQSQSQSHPQGHAATTTTTATASVSASTSTQQSSSSGLTDTQRSTFDRADEDYDADDGDVSMTTVAPSQPSQPPLTTTTTTTTTATASQERGTKRSLDEDEDY